MKRGIILLIAIILLSGCSTYSASRYSMSADNVVALRTHDGKTINVGPFSSTKGVHSEIMCRAVGPIKTPDGESFSEYIRKALIDELRIANVFSPAAPVTLTGNLDQIDFDSNMGYWNLELTVKSSNAKVMTVTENYSYTTSFFGETACNQTAQALMPAVQNLVGKIVRSPDFLSLISE